ncbi:Atg31p [Saccharomycodes ludwigii]|uniref:Atg31p n=1 Tax=Saccharomycodes ludwigii TaxID=36035 RepID=UPI001E89515A|nr:conserved putative autophagy-related 31 protein [Saccharomycodes ludwigii]KAH3900619.1 conserved putative autophagy-related 31 protein [Saccharomycodes ludwigii]
MDNQNLITHQNKKPLILSILDENVLLNNSTTIKTNKFKKEEEPLYYLTNNIHYIFEDDDTATTSTPYNNINNDSDNNIENIITIDVDKDFNLLNADLLSDKYQLIDCVTSTTATSDTTGTVNNNKNTGTLQLKVLSEFKDFVIDPNNTQYDINDLIYIYKEQNKQLQKLLNK